MREEELVRIAISWVQENALDLDFTGGDLDKNADLLTTGVLDSIGFIDLLTLLETELGHPIDLADADPEEFTSIKGLCRFALVD